MHDGRDRDDLMGVKRRFESVLVGGALAVSGVVNRKLGDVDRRLDERAQTPVAPPAPAPEPARQAAPVRPAPPSPSAPPANIPGMPLPTGYGLQVRGPQGESIVLPVCLPPGFELDSMMLCPEFLPRVAATGPQRRATDGRPAPIPTEARPAPPVIPAPPVPVPPTSRLDGMLQLVFGAEQRFTSSLEHTDEPAPAPAAAAPRPSAAPSPLAPHRP
jgi:hypothetical protein